MPPARIAECGARHPGAARKARVPHRRGRPRLGRQPALPADAGLRQARADRERYESFMERARRADRRTSTTGSLKAEHGTGGTWRRTSSASGATKATEMMWRIKQLADPDGVLNPGVLLEPRPGGPPAQHLKTQPPIEESRRERLRRVRLLRAGLPEPQPDDDAAPADRAAPRDGAPARGLAGARGAARATTSYDAIADLRRRRHVPARVPGRRSTPASSMKELRARATSAASASGARCALAARAGRRSSARRAPGFARRDGGRGVLGDGAVRGA